MLWPNRKNAHICYTNSRKSIERSGFNSIFCNGIVSCFVCNFWLSTTTAMDVTIAITVSHASLLSKPSKLFIFWPLPEYFQFLIECIWLFAIFNWLDYSIHRSMGIDFNSFNDRISLFRTLSVYQRYGYGYEKENKFCGICFAFPNGWNRTLVDLCWRNWLSQPDNWVWLWF